MKKVIFILFLSLAFTYANGQEIYNSSGKPGYHKKTSSHHGYDPSKLILGGGLTAGFGDGYVAAGIAPIVGYHFTRRLVAGVGLGYLYNQQPDPITFSALNNSNNTYYDKESIVSPNIWARYFVYRGLYLTGTFEYNFINFSEPSVDYDQYGNEYIVQSSGNVWVPCLLFGPGIRQPIGGRAAVFVEVLYDVLQQQYSPYLNQPVVRFGICVGL